MPPLLAAATDHTGRIITFVSGGLVAVAVGLTILTVWYWRFTSPSRRSRPAVAADGPVLPASAADDWVDGDVGSMAAVTADISSVLRRSPPEVPGARPGGLSTPPSVEGAVPTEDSLHGLDGDQWELLTQAVMDRFLGDEAAQDLTDCSVTDFE